MRNKFTIDQVLWAKMESRVAILVVKSPFKHTSQLSLSEKKILKYQLWSLKSHRPYSFKLWEEATKIYSKSTLLKIITFKSMRLRILAQKRLSKR